MRNEHASLNCIRLAPNIVLADDIGCGRASVIAAINPKNTPLTSSAEPEEGLKSRSTETSGAVAISKIGTLAARVFRQSSTIPFGLRRRKKTRKE